MQRHISAVRLADLIGSVPRMASGPDGRGAEAAYLRLADGLRQAIGEGRLPEGTRLPSERELTGPTGLSRTTVTRAYAELRDQGYLRTRRGSGSVVQVPNVPGGRVDHLLTPADRDGRGATEDLFDLTCTAPAATSHLTEAYTRALDDLGAYLPGTGYYPSGLLVLRERIADRFTARGLPTDPDQVLVTAGALASLATVCGALITRRDSILVESPTYPNAIAVLAGTGARIVSHPLDHLTDDWDVAHLTRTLRHSRPRAAYLIPDFHNPTGALLAADQRVEIGRALRAAGTTAVIDESLAELALNGQEMPPPLGRQLPDALTIGSASKTLWGGLRIGWVRAPRARIDDLAASRLRLDLGAPVVEQLATAHLLDRYDEILAERRAGLRASRDTLVAGLTEHLPDWQVRVPSGGMALWCALPQHHAAGSVRVGSTLMTAAARQHGVALAAGPNFAPTGGLDGWLRLPYALPAHQLEHVPERLAAAWADVVSGRVQTATRREQRFIA